MDNNRIGILTLPFGPNYGNILQAYALSRVLIKKGKNPIILKRRWNQPKIHSLIYRIKRKIYYGWFCRDIAKLYNTIPKTQDIRTSKDLLLCCIDNNVEKIVVGSDQVWCVPNTRGVELNFFCDFVNENSKIKRYSYAASFGKDKLYATTDEKIAIKRLLYKFRMISVRENTGVNILNNEFGISSHCVLDPTFLLTIDEWEKIAFSHVSQKKSEVVTYILDDSKEKRNAIAKFAKDNGLRVHNLYNRKILPYYSVEHWLSKIRNSEFVIVDSFHGMVFAIIFRKEFLAISNKKRGETRFTSLLNKLGLEDRLIYDIQEINNKEFHKIDYKPVNLILEKERKKSLEFIDNIIND